MERVAAVGLAVARYWLSGWVDERFGPSFPAGTLAVNLLGCFGAGFLFHALSEKYLIDPGIRSAVLVGWFGGFTTLSSFGLQTFALLRDSQFVLAGINVVMTNVAAVVGVWAGYSLSRSL